MEEITITLPLIKETKGYYKFSKNEGVIVSVYIAKDKFISRPEKIEIRLTE